MTGDRINKCDLNILTIHPTTSEYTFFPSTSIFANIDHMAGP